MKIAVFFVLVLLPSSAGAQQPSAASATQAMYNAAAASAEAKFRHVEENARRHPPDQTPTVLTEREINAYLNSGQVQLPVGVRSARFAAQNGVVNAAARVDFDAITAQSKTPNPLLSLFSGIHDVHAMAHASGSGRKGRVHIDSIDIDGVTVPRVALQFFLDRYIRPKHPEVGLDSVFALPARIDIATVGDHQLMLTQK
ncbi:MAG: hypothetical protein LAN64_01300 [Acidobacteriia bacterium]|nr:hypothetical protein [Terriglobia bacterium]